jgi:hypothetical protein
MATLGELRTEPFVVVPFTGVPADTAFDEARAEVPADQWTVLVGPDGPVSALPPGTMPDGGVLEAGVRLPGILVAAADMAQEKAFFSAGFRQSGVVSALVLIGEVRETGQLTVTGLVSDETLTDALLRGPVRGGTDSVLPGTPLIPLITRSCGFYAGAGACATTMSFQSKPFTMPQCRNARGLSKHSFVW